MKEKIHLKHNTYLVTGSTSASLPQVLFLIEENLSIPIKGNPDFWHGTFSLFTIDDSRTLKSMVAMKPFGDRRALIIEALQLTTEAQQAILKLSEELTKDSYLFILVPTLEQILPTLRSRFIHLPIIKGGATVSQDAKTFIESPWKDRQKKIESITKAKDPRAAYLLLEHIEELLYSEGKRDGLAHVIGAKKRILEGVIPLKTILETVALIIPR